MQIQDKRERRAAGAARRRAGGGRRRASGSRAWKPSSPPSASPSRNSIVDIDREKTKAQAVSLSDVNNTLQAYLGAYYVNDFFFQDRNWQVNVQADPRYRMKVEDIGRLEVRNAEGRPGAAGDAHSRKEHGRPARGQPLQPLPFRRIDRHPRAGNEFAARDRNHGPGRRRPVADDDGLRMDGGELPGDRGE